MLSLWFHQSYQTSKFIVSILLAVYFTSNHELYIYPLAYERFYCRQFMIFSKILTAEISCIHMQLMQEIHWNRYIFPCSKRSILNQFHLIYLIFSRWYTYWIDNIHIKKFGIATIYILCNETLSQLCKISFYKSFQIFYLKLYNCMPNCPLYQTCCLHLILVT